VGLGLYLENYAAEMEDAYWGVVFAVVVMLLVPFLVPTCVEADDEVVNPLANLALKQSIRKAVDKEWRDKIAHRLCLCCQMQPRTRFAVPCGHVVFCMPCAAKFIEANQSACPLCRTPIEGLRRIWL